MEAHARQTVDGGTRTPIAITATRCCGTVCSGASPSGVGTDDVVKCLKWVSKHEALQRTRLTSSLTFAHGTKYKLMENFVGEHTYALGQTCHMYGKRFEVAEGHMSAHDLPLMYGVADVPHVRQWREVAEGTCPPETFPTCTGSFVGEKLFARGQMCHMYGNGAKLLRPGVVL